MWLYNSHMHAYHTCHSLCSRHDAHTHTPPPNGLQQPTHVLYLAANVHTVLSEADPKYQQLSERCFTAATKPSSRLQSICNRGHASSRPLAIPGGSGSITAALASRIPGAVPGMASHNQWVTGTHLFKWVTQFQRAMHASQLKLLF